MTSQTLTITSQHTTYIAGMLFTNIITAEECVLSLLYTSTKPTRKKNPAIQEPGMKTHRWLYSLKDVHRIEDLVATPNTVHNFIYRFPELNDTIWYTALYKGEEATTSPQAPIFAARIPLTLLYSQLWPGETLPDPWQPDTIPDISSVTVTPGRAAMATLESPFGTNRLTLPPLNFDPLQPLWHGSIFILYDALYRPVNQDDLSFYAIVQEFNSLTTGNGRTTFIYGDINDLPCDIGIPGFLGNFQPHAPHLFATDLYTEPTDDLCGDPFAPGSDWYLTAFRISLQNLNPVDGTLTARAVMRPFAVFRQLGPMQDISRRWMFLKPLLPQGSTPNFVQRAVSQ